VNLLLLMKPSGRLVMPFQAEAIAEKASAC
jgi:hypothetical protein